MTEKPKKAGGAQKALCPALIAAAVVLFYLSNVLPVPALWQAGSVLLLFFAVDLTVKYGLRQYEYRLEGNFLYAAFYQGEKKKELGSLEICAETEFLTREEWKQRAAPAAERVRVVQNLFSKNEMVLISPLGRARCALFFEPGEDLSAAIRREIEKQKGIEE